MSDRDSWNDPLREPAAPPPVPKKKMSGCLLASLIVGGIGLMGLLVCCGGVTWIYFNFAPTISSESAVVKAVGHEVLDTELLPDFEPAISIVMDNMFFAMRVAEFKHKDGKGEMMIGNMKIKMGDAGQMNAQAGQARENFEKKTHQTIDIKNTEIEQVKINGKDVPVTIGEGTQRETGKAYHTLTADFDMPAGKTFVILQLEDEVWDKAAALKMLEDAKAK